MEKMTVSDYDFSEDTLFITSQCNSNCIMCPDSEKARRRLSKVTLDGLVRQIENMPKDISFLCITGGEPTLIKYDLIDILRLCREKFMNTDFLLLTNGRSFSDLNYVLQFQKSIPNFLMVGIPIYGSNEKDHDEITQTKNSFKQTISGIENLINLGISVEIRVVVMKQNFQKLEEISKFIFEKFSGVVRVNFMGLEVMGNALYNKDVIWIDYEKCKSYLKSAALYLISNGVDCQFYNFPLCYIDKSLWSICKRSITREKVRYPKECDICTAKSMCGGFFASTLAVVRPNVLAIL